MAISEIMSRGGGGEASRSQIWGEFHDGDGWGFYGRTLFGSEGVKGINYREKTPPDIQSCPNKSQQKKVAIHQIENFPLNANVC